MFEELVKDSKHYIFGGWLSNIFQPGTDRLAKKIVYGRKTPSFKSRKLLRILKESKRTNMKKGLNRVTTDDGPKDYNCENVRNYSYE